MSRVKSRRGTLSGAALAAAMALGGTGPAAFAQQTASLVRLTPEQYERSIHDIFGADIQHRCQQRRSRDSAMMACWRSATGASR